jgi:hypothetical protein
MSAQANAIGFFGKGRRGIDYPDVPEWPDGYVSVPVHTVDYKKDTVRDGNCFSSYFFPRPNLVLFIWAE